MSELPLDAKIFVAGHRGMVGSAITRALRTAGYRNLVTRTRAELDLMDRAAVRTFFQREAPPFVFLAAAKVGGIMANNLSRGEFLHDNLAIQLNVMDEARRAGVQRLLFLGSSCIYPKLAPQPMKEEHFLTGLLESTNRPYAIAKIAGIEMVDAYRRQYGLDYRAAMPTNLYGPGDNFDLATSHVIPALIHKFHDAVATRQPAVSVWGSGTPKREFLHVDDLAEACVFLMALAQNAWQRLDHPFVNVGTGEDLSIRELAELLRGISGFAGELVFDASKPDGTPRKLMDVSRIHGLGWRHRRPLAQGLASVYEWFGQHPAVAASAASH